MDRATSWLVPCQCVGQLRRTDIGFAIRIMRLRAWTAIAALPACPSFERRCRPHGCHVRRVRRPIGTRAKEPVVVVGVDVMDLHRPHQMHCIGATGKAAVSIEYVVADRLGAGDPLRANPERAGAMLRLRHAMRHGPVFVGRSAGDARRRAWRPIGLWRGHHRPWHAAESVST